jgi:hypothetical protein
VEGPAAVRVLQSGDCTTVAAANQAAEGGVQLGRPDPAGAGEVLRRRCDWDHERPARPTVRLEVSGGRHSQRQPVDGGRAKREVWMEPDTGRGRFPVGVDRLACQDQTGLTQGIGDLEVELPLVSGLRSHSARECDRAWMLCDKRPVQPAHQPMDCSVPTSLSGA